MSDLLELGPTRRTPRWRTTAIVAGLALAVGALLVRQSAGGSHPEAGPAPAASSPEATEPAPNPTTSTPQPAPAGPSWPRKPGACGNDAALPLLSVRTLLVHTGLHVFVGGNGLRLVDVDTGRVQRVAVPGDGLQVTELQAAAGRLYALAQPCSSALSASDVLSVDRGGRSAARTSVRGVDDLLAGAGGAWAFRYPDRPSARLVLRPIEGGSRVKLPAGFAPWEVTRRSFLGSLEPTAGEDEDQRPVLAAVDRSSIREVHPVGLGEFLAGNDAFVLYDSCVDNERCVITQRRADGTQRRFALPAGRVPYSAAVLSDDRRLVAFQLARARPDGAYAVDHPGNPSDLAVLDMVTGKIEVLRGLELAPKSQANLAFSRDSRWLLISLNEGDRGRLLVWRSGWPGPQQSPTMLPGTILYNVPVFDAARTS